MLTGTIKLYYIMKFIACSLLGQKETIPDWSFTCVRDYQKFVLGHFMQLRLNIDARLVAGFANSSAFNYLDVNRTILTKGACDSACSVSISFLLRVLGCFATFCAVTDGASLDIGVCVSGSFLLVVGDKSCLSMFWYLQAVCTGLLDFCGVRLEW